MQKMKLAADELRVESFDVMMDDDTRGTVKAAALAPTAQTMQCPCDVTLTCRSWC